MPMLKNFPQNEDTAWNAKTQNLHNLFYTTSTETFI